MTADSKLPAVARNISLDCKKCGIERYHVVVAHLTEESAKVKCEVCGAQKTYKVGGAAKRVSKPRVAGAAAAAKNATRIAEEWQALNQKLGSTTAQNYNMRMRFTPSQVIQHPKFGLGFVTAVTAEKIDVTFEDGIRSLVHNRA